MEAKTKMLIAVGAAFITQCQPCLKTVILKALESGASQKEIVEAIGVARFVRKNALMQIDRFTSSLAEINIDDFDENACGCNQSMKVSNSQRR